MKKNISILATSILVLTLIFVAFNVSAEEKESNIDNKMENNEQMETSNMGEDMKIQIQNKEQAQIGVEDGAKASVQVKINNQNDNSSEDEADGMMDEESEMNDNGNMMDEGNKDDSKQDDKSNNKEKEKERSQISSERKSAVATAVQEMLQVADRNGGIGEQVRVIAQNQIKTQAALENKLEEVEGRGAFVHFLIGPKYSGIKDAEKLLEQNQEQINNLNQVKLELKNESDIQVLDQQIKLLEQANIEISNSLETSKKGFSLFGWLSKVFVK